jgi:hypothetical protein
LILTEPDYMTANRVAEEINVVLPLRLLQEIVLTPVK